MILIEPDAYVPRSALPKRELSRFLMDACERVGVVGEVTVLMTTDERMRELNRTFRRKNKPTDVLSFPAGAPVFAGEEVSGGDLAISVDMARRQAEGLGHALLVEVEILVLHGLLHLAGMDHEQDTGQMGRREAKLRREFELPAGLIQRSAKAGPGGTIPTSQKRDVGHPGLRKTDGKATGKMAAKASQKTPAKPSPRAKTSGAMHLQEAKGRPAAAHAR